MGKGLVGFVLGLLIVPIIAACVVFSGHFPVRATAAPPTWERRIANMALDPSVAHEAQGLASPLTGTDDDLMKGLKVYRDDCAGCHGDHGKTSHWGRNNFYPPAPGLARHAMDDPIPNIFAIVKYGIRYTGMAGWKDEIPDLDIWRVATFLSREDKLPANVDSVWVHPPR